MSTRALSFLLALSLFFSAFMAAGAAAQAGHAGANASLASSVGDTAPQPPQGLHGLGSADTPDHAPVDSALGEQPAQGLLELAAEPVAIFSSHPGTLTPPLSMAQPRAPAVAAWPTPDLDGPRRPPRPSALLG